MHGELAEAAGVPVLAPAAAPLAAFVDDVETVAGRAEEGTGAAAGAAAGDLLPHGMLEVAIQPGADLL